MATEVQIGDGGDTDDALRGTAGLGLSRVHPATSSNIRASTGPDSGGAWSAYCTGIM
jgi:hypothetical protein